MEKSTKAPDYGMTIQGLKERIRYFARAQYDFGQNYFESYCGLGGGTISAIKSNGPTAAVLMKILSKCPELNLNWLFRGEGPMLLEGHTPAEGKEKESAQAPYVQNAKAVFIANWDGMKDVIRQVITETMNEK